MSTEEIRIYCPPEEKPAGVIAPLLRDLYRRSPETRHLAAWELQALLWSLGYADELLDEGENSGRHGGGMARVLRADEGCRMRLTTGRRPTRVIPKGGRTLVSAMCKHMFAKRNEGQTSAPAPVVYRALDRFGAFHLLSLSTQCTYKINKEEEAC